jgi:hypothetical protein
MSPSVMPRGAPPRREARSERLRFLEMQDRVTRCVRMLGQAKTSETINRAGNRRRIPRPSQATIDLGLGELSYVVSRSPRVERAMGIEPTGNALPSLENKRFGENADAKCD